MIRFICNITLVIFSISLSNAQEIRPMLNSKKFNTPAAKFVGLWRVESYDFREFLSIPEDIEPQVEKGKKFAALPIGQIIEFQSLGTEVMPGTIDPTTMKSIGPTGPVLAMILHAPFDKKLCSRSYWESACEEQNKPFRSEVMITDIVNWWTYTSPKNKTLWVDLTPFEYTLNDLGKLFYLEARIAKNGEIVLQLSLEGKGLNGSEGGVVGVRLKKVK